MSDFSVNILPFKIDNNVWKSEIDQIVLTRNKVDTNGAPVFSPDYSASVLTAKMCTNSDEDSMYIRFLWFG